MMGPCAKKTVRCTIKLQNGAEVMGENWCRRPQSTCPREPGDDYTKCHTICEQVGHAEMEALRLTLAMDLDPTGASALIEGHTYACQSCQEALYEAGVKWVGVKVGSAPKTLVPPWERHFSFYKSRKGITT